MNSKKDSKEKETAKRRFSTLTLSNIPKDESDHHGKSFVEDFIVNFSEQKIEANWINYMVAAGIALNSLHVSVY
jgi:hypothetical protein